MKWVLSPPPRQGLMGRPSGPESPVPPSRLSAIRGTGDTCASVYIGPSGEGGRRPRRPLFFKKTIFWAHKCHTPLIKLGYDLPRNQICYGSPAG